MDLVRRALGRTRAGWGQGPAGDRGPPCLGQDTGRVGTGDPPATSLQEAGEGARQPGGQCVMQKHSFVFTVIYWTRKHLCQPVASGHWPCLKLDCRYTSVSP